MGTDFKIVEIDMYNLLSKDLYREYKKEMHTLRVK